MVTIGLITGAITVSGWAARAASNSGAQATTATMPSVATTATVRQASTPEPPAVEDPLALFLSLPFVEEKPNLVIAVDFSNDPEAAFAALEAATPLLEGRQVMVTGIEVAAPRDRRQQDAKLSRLDVPVSRPLCPDQPTGSRSLDGSTVAYLGCDPRDGTETRGQRFEGNAEVSLAHAIDQVLAVHLAGIPLSTVAVTILDGAAVVDLPAEIAAIRRLPKEDGWALARDLVFTAHSNGSVDSVHFTIEGDCLAFALAVGGDSCSTATFGG